jgi:hypothetical protein
MAVATRPSTELEQRQLKMFFEQTRPLPQLLSTLRSRRVGRGYAIESGEKEVRGATGHTLHQERGPLAFKSEHEVMPLTEVEEAILAWSACGPNGMVHWDIAVHGGFHELHWAAGRTSGTPGNSCASDLLVINDSGASIYNPGMERSKIVEIEGEADYEKVLTWYRQGSTRVLDHRPDVDWMTRVPGAPNATIFGPYQFNLNREGTTWMIPITDVGWLYLSFLLNLFDFWHVYMIDDATQKPAGVDRWVGEGRLEFPITIAQSELFFFQVEMYPPGSMVQNMRLSAEAMGLGNWIFCGYFDDVLMGAFPDVAKGLQFRCEALNPKAPATGALKIFGVEGVKEATYVPSPRFKDGRAVIDHFIKERWGTGGALSKGDDNWVLSHGGPFKPEVMRDIVNHPVCQVSDWAIEASAAYIDYCVERYGQCPVNFNPMLCNFGAVIHHVDEAFYERYYVGGGNMTSQIHEHMQRWH